MLPGRKNLRWKIKCVRKRQRTACGEIPRVQGMTWCWPLWVSKHYPRCLNLFQSVQPGPQTSEHITFGNVVLSGMHPLKRVQAKQAGGRRASRDPSSLFVVPPQHTVQHRLSIWKAPLFKTKLPFASKPQLLNHYFKKPKRLVLCQYGKKLFKSICSPAL